MKKATGLGRGLSALLDDAARQPRSGEAGARPGGVVEVEVARIRPNPTQPRQHFDPDALDELARSIGDKGVLQPILIRPAGDGQYQIIAGERRWRAAQRAQLHQIPAIVRELDDSAVAEVALIENVQRSDLSAIEEAEGYRQLIAAHGHGQDDIARIVGKSRSHVSNLLRLLELPAEVRDMLLRGDISMGHARAIATAPDPVEIARRIVSEGLSVRQVESLARQDKPARKKNGAVSTRPVDADLAALERQLGDLLGLKVRVAHGQSGGTVALSYSSLDQLDMICQRLSGEPI